MFNAIFLKKKVIQDICFMYKYTFCQNGVPRKRIEVLHFFRKKQRYMYLEKKALVGKYL